jgi:GAF domain-containing protein
MPESVMTLNQVEKSLSGLGENVQDKLKGSQQTLIHRLLRITVFGGVFILISELIDALNSHQYIPLLVAGLIYLGVLVVTFTPGVTYVLQSSVFILSLYALGVFSMISAGFFSHGILFLLAVTALSPQLFNRRLSILATFIVICTVVVFVYLFARGVIVLPSESIIYGDNLTELLSGGITLVLIGALLVIPQDFLFHRLAKTFSLEQQLSNELESVHTNLEERIADQTQTANRRDGYLRALTIVTREVADVIEDPERLFHRVVNVISEQFGFYHTGLFLNDDTGEWVELKAASSEGGEKMLARSHRLQVGSQGIVGYVANHGKFRLAYDVGEDAMYFSNPDLPDTRSEVALPLLIRGNVIGVLDVQSTVIEAFKEDDIAVMQLLADQVALAINKAHLYRLAQKSIEKERQLQGAMTRQGWRNLLHSESHLRARSTTSSVSSENNAWTAEMKMALEKGQVVIDEETEREITLPIRISGQTVGIVVVRKSNQKAKLSDEEIRLLGTLTDQLNSAVERVRLYRQSQLIAARQRSITEVGAKIRASLQLETMLQTAANEIREEMDLSEVEIRLAPPVVVSAQENHINIADGIVT